MTVDCGLPLYLRAGNGPEHRMAVVERPGDVPRLLREIADELEAHAINALYPDAPMGNEVEAHHFIALMPDGFHLGIAELGAFKAPARPITLHNGVVAYPVSEGIYRDWTGSEDGVSDD